MAGGKSGVAATRGGRREPSFTVRPDLGYASRHVSTVANTATSDPTPQPIPLDVEQIRLQDEPIGRGSRPCWAAGGCHDPRRLFLRKRSLRGWWGGESRDELPLLHLSSNDRSPVRLVGILSEVRLPIHCGQADRLSLERHRNTLFLPHLRLPARVLVQIRTTGRHISWQP